MKTTITLLLAIALLTASCQNLDRPDPIQEEQRLNIEELTGIQHDIAVNILTSKYGGFVKSEKKTRAANQFTITPYIEDGDTLLYIAQYDDGWEIYSASYAAPMLLFASDNGTFDMSDNTLIRPLKDMILACAQEMRVLKNKDNKLIDPSWKGFVSKDEDLIKGTVSVLDNDGSRKIVFDGDLPPGHWILIESEKIYSETYTSPKLINTKWGQSTPWNIYAKTVYDPVNKKYVLAPAGCAPVALSQYLYFTHFKDGIPLYAPTNAISTSNGKDFEFYGSSSSIWNNMAKWDFFPGTDKSAILIGDVGRKINCNYMYDMTGAYHTDCLEMLKTYYGFDFTLIPFSFDNLMLSIDNGYPLLASAYSNKNSNGENKPKSGHMFIIDQYQIKTDSIRDTYALVRDPLPAGTINRWQPDLIDDEGNVIAYAYTKKVFWESCSKQISMNWGYSGINDNVFLYYIGDWVYGNTNYNLDHEIFARPQ